MHHVIQLRKTKNEKIAETEMNIKSKIKFYVHKGHSESDATALAIADAQQVINDMDEKLNKAIDFLSVEEVREVYGDLEK